MTEALVPVEWRRREPPLPAAAVYGEGAVARRLADRLLARADLASLTAVAGSDGARLIVIGAAENLPWADGAVYLGREPVAPLYVPTTTRPSAPAELVYRALAARLARSRPPLAVLPELGLVLPLGRARPIDRAALGRFRG